MTGPGRGGLDVGGPFVGRTAMDPIRRLNVVY